MTSSGKKNAFDVGVIVHLMDNEASKQNSMTVTLRAIVAQADNLKRSANALVICRTHEEFVLLTSDFSRQLGDGWFVKLSSGQFGHQSGVRGRIACVTNSKDLRKFGGMEFSLIAVCDLSQI